MYTELATVRYSNFGNHSETHSTRRTGDFSYSKNEAPSLFFYFLSCRATPFCYPFFSCNPFLAPSG